LPDVLVLLNGSKINDVKTWKDKRRPELIKLFEENVYERNGVDRPEEMIREIISIDNNAFESSAITKKELYL
jgi:hypothetical protein